MKNPSSVLPAVLLLLLLTACGPISPMQPNVPNGGRAVAVARHPANDNEFFVASETGGVFKSSNAGATWSQVTGSNTFGFTDVKYCVADPTIIIATASNDTKTSTGGGIWRSTNSGTSWSQVTLAPPDAGCGSTLSANCIAVEPGNNKIWVGTTCGLAVSTDNGATFSFIAASANYHNETVYAVLAPQANQIKILTDAGVKVSGNDGTSWSFSVTGLPYMAKGQHGQLACSPLNHQHIFWAANFAPGDGKWHNGMYFSADNGNTWTNVIDNIGINRPPTCFTAHALNGDANKFDLYFSDGACELERASFTNTTPPAMSGSWVALNTPHCDYADLCFKTDGKSPALLLGDGGIFSTADNGAHWAFTGGGSNGYDALQITEVTGQLHSADDNSDLYYATQDNDIRASGDGGVTWPAANKLCCEGFFMNIPRESLPAAQTKLTLVACGACGNFGSGPLLAGLFNFPNVANSTGNPRLLVPGSYIESDTLAGAPTVSIFSLTTNTGGSWIPKYAFTNTPEDLSKIAGDEANPVVFTAVQEPGTTPDGQGIVGLKRISDVLGAGSPLVSDVGGFGSIGIFPTMFAWYKPFGVDAHDPNHLIVPDIITDKVRVSTDGGITWTDDNNLTDLVTQSGTFKFRSDAFTQISNIAFDPDVHGRILVGTVQAGIFSSCDNGGSWSKVSGSEVIPYVSSFYFLGNDHIVASSYGRGLWKLSLPACPTLTLPPHDFQYGEPLIYWKGGYVPISQIHDPEVCPVCGYVIVDHGDISQYHISNTNEIRDLAITGGNLRGFTFDAKSLQLPFQVSRSTEKFNAREDKTLESLLSKGYKFKGVYVEGKLLKGLLLAKEDIQVSQLPKKQELKTFLKADAVKDAKTGDVTSIRLIAKGFAANGDLTLYIDGKPSNLLTTAKLSLTKENNRVVTLSNLLTPGGHTISLVQKGPGGVTRETTTIIIPLNDNRERKQR